MTWAKMSDAEAARIYGEAYDWRGALENYVFDKYAPKPRLERDPSQPIGLLCPKCNHRPAWRDEGGWLCPDCQARFTLSDVLRYLWKPSSDSSGPTESVGPKLQPAGD